MIHKKMALSVAIFVAVVATIIGTSALTNATDGDSSVTTTNTAVTTQHEKTITELKAEIKQKVTTNIENRVKTKLETKRLTICENHQAKINQIFSNATEQNKKNLAVFQDIQAKVEKFYVDKGLSSTDYADAVADADSLEASAEAAIAVSTETTFDCATADGTNPGAVIKDTMETRHSALKAYREAVRNLITVVKKANSDKNAASANSSENK